MFLAVVGNDAACLFVRLFVRSLLCLLDVAVVVSALHCHPTKDKVHMCI